MSEKQREKFATQVDPDVLSEVRTLARQEGRQLQSLVDEALLDLLEKRRSGRSRPGVMAAYDKSHELYGRLYKKLAQ
jgi:hypothetical protein